MLDAVRGYLSMASGLTEVPRRAASAAAKALFAQGEATAEQVTQLTDELMATSRSNREALSNLIRYEVERTLDQMGLVTADKLRALSARVATLEAAARSDGRAPSAPAAKATKAKAPAAKAAAKRAPAKKAAAKRAPASKAAPSKTT